MPLSVSRWTEDVLEDFESADAYCEGVQTVVVKAGWHDDPATGESIQVAGEKVMTNQYGIVIRQDLEEWDYDIAGAPPLEYRRETHAMVYLPGISSGRFTTTKVEEERIVYYPWSAFQPGSANLSRRRVLSGYAIYDMRPQPDALTAEEKEKLSDRGQNPEGSAGLIVDSARTWQQATSRGEIVEEASAPQVSKWVDPMETETEIVFEEMDKWTLYRIRKNHLRPGDTTFEGPEHRKKESWTYRLPVPVDPPSLSLSIDGDNGVRIEIEGGGATVNSVKIPPEKYRLLRRTISEPDRSPEGDPFGLRSTPPEASSTARMWIDTNTTELDGTPASSLPSQESYDEPGDTSDPDTEGWRLIAEPENAAGPRDDGRAIVLDDDVLSTAVYEYVATAIIGRDESAPSERVQITYGGADHASRIRSHVRRTDDGSLEIDVVAPLDPAFPEYGDTVIFEDLPILLYEDTAGDFGDELGLRHFADDRRERLEVELKTTIPLITLERGQRVKIPKVEWTTTGNGLIITSETEQKTFELDGFRLGFTRRPDGKLTVDSSDLYLVER